MDQFLNEVKDSYVIFSMGEHRFGLSLEAVSEISGIDDVIVLEDAPANVLGIIRTRDKYIPVYNLIEKFKIPPIKDSEVKKRRIVTHFYNKSVAFEVEAVLGVELIHKEDIYPVPRFLKFVSNRYIRQIANKDEEVTLLLDENALIDEREYDEILSLISTILQKQ